MFKAKQELDNGCVMLSEKFSILKDKISCKIGPSRGLDIRDFPTSIMQ